MGKVNDDFHSKIVSCNLNLPLHPCCCCCCK